MPRLRSILILLLPFALANCGGGNSQHDSEKKARGTPWPTISTAEAGLNESALQTFAQAVGGNGVLIRYDKLAFTWGQPDKALDVASASKPVMAHFVFKAIEAGKIASLDEPVAKWLPELGHLNPALHHKDANITWRHLLNQTSCYGVTEAPGTAYDYNDFQTALLWTLIYEKVSNVPREEITAQVLGPQLFDLIGAQDKPKLRLQPEPKVNGRLVISPRDFARLGLVYLHGGKWNGQPIIDAAHVGTAIGSPLPLTLPRTQGKDADMLPHQRSYGGGKNQEDHLGCYTFMWWLNRDKELWPSLPADTFAAIGNGGPKTLMVIPSLDLVLAWNDANMKPLPLYAGGREQMEAVLVKLMDAVR